MCVFALPQCGSRGKMEINRKSDDFKEEKVLLRSCKIFVRIFNILKVKYLFEFR